MITNRDATATIANGASLSGAIYLGIGTMCAIQMPAAWTAASLSFQGSTDGSTYNDMYDSSGVEITIAASASQYIVLDPSAFMGFVWVKLRSGTTGTPVNQGAARALKVFNRVQADA